MFVAGKEEDLQYRSTIESRWQRIYVEVDVEEIVPLCGYSKG
jgi:hypothetical protein